MIAQPSEQKDVETPKAEPPEPELKPGFSQEEKEFYQTSLVVKALMLCGGQVELKLKTAKALPKNVYVESYMTNDNKSIGIRIKAPPAKRKRGKIFVPKKKKLII